MKNKINVSSSDCLDIISDGAMANPYTADGRLIPVIILDATHDSRLSNLENIHKDFAVGDANSTWAFKRFSNKFVYLILRFEKPAELKIAVKFDVSKHSNLVDGVIQFRAVYLQSGKQGDMLSSTVDAPKILVEIPARTTFENWEDILTKSVEKKLKKEGVGRKKIKAAVNEYILTKRGIWARRFR